jgi:hypothetical protein
MGAYPDWYPVFQAAKYLNMSVPDLIKESIWYLDKALIAISAENGAQEIKNKRK